VKIVAVKTEREREQKFVVPSRRHCKMRNRNAEIDIWVR